MIPSYQYTTFGKCVRAFDQHTKVIAAIYVVILAIFVTIMALHQTSDQLKRISTALFSIIHVPPLLLFTSYREEIERQRRWHDHEKRVQDHEDKIEEHRCFISSMTTAASANGEIDTMMGSYGAYPRMEVGNKDIENLLFLSQEVTAPVMEGSFPHPLNKEYELTFYAIKYRARNNSHETFVITLYQKQLARRGNEGAWYAVGDTRPLFGSAGDIQLTGSTSDLESRRKSLKELIQGAHRDFCLV
jgi:hypothetical protein